MYMYFFFKHLYWSIIALQWCVSFCFITKWISYTYTYLLPLASPSHPPYPTPLGGHKAPSWSPWPFHFLDSVLWCTKVFNFYEIRFFVIVVAFAFSVISKKSLPNPKWWRFSLLFFFFKDFFWCAASGGPSSSRCAGLSPSQPLVAEHRLQTRRLSSCGSRAQLLRGMWDLPGPGLEPVSPALAGRLPTTAPPGKPFSSFLLRIL